MVLRKMNCILPDIPYCLPPLYHDIQDILLSYSFSSNRCMIINNILYKSLPIIILVINVA